MLYGIISDIHGNLEALNSVLGRLGKVDQIVNLGDIVGYGPNPNECINKLKELNVPTVAGNNDKVASGEIDPEWFNKNAKNSILWTGEQLTKTNKAYLKNLPLVVTGDDFQFVHGSLRYPLDEYVTSLSEAIPTFEKMTRQLCFIGHSHSPMFIAKTKEGDYSGRALKDGEEVLVDNFDKIIINVGGVGQPRDGDPRACFGTYNSKTKIFTLHRVEYDIKKVQEKMKKAKLPQSLIDRLSLGR
jgi:predicted phosphodiesterase